jgi:tetratricopeptide (TPR) repeat protein
MMISCVLRRASGRAPLSLVALVAAISTFACASASDPMRRQACYDPDSQLAQVLAALEANGAGSCWEPQTGETSSRCDALRREIERLALVCPNHVPTLMANAVIAHETRQSEKAQQFLDRIFERPSSHPDAAVLRARIAIEEGDLSFARRLLKQQIVLAPGHAGLHETYGAVLYLTRELDESRRELAKAEALGAPRWRMAYHLGLIAEAAGRLDEAQRLYAEVLDKHPGWPPAESRLKALRAPH